MGGCCITELVAVPVFLEASRIGSIRRTGAVAEDGELWPAISKPGSGSIGILYDACNGCETEELYRVVNLEVELNGKHAGSVVPYEKERLRRRQCRRFLHGELLTTIN